MRVKGQSIEKITKQSIFWQVLLQAQGKEKVILNKREA
jgi:hypothetical protein